MEEPNEKRPLREISDEELKQVLKAHEIWLSSDGKEGQCADLESADLSDKPLFKVNLSKAKLQYANLNHAVLIEVNLESSRCEFAEFSRAMMTNTKFDGANLIGADLSNAALNFSTFNKALLIEANLQDSLCECVLFSGADLAEANFTNAVLWRANLKQAALRDIKGLNTANLHNANFEGATGLKGTEFARADITGARLPEGIRDFAGLITVEETSKNARKIFFSTLIACVYCWLTIGTTTDVNLLTNSASSPLPIIGTAIPIAWFYLIAPLLLACLYFYLHFYLQRLWKSMAGLPAIFEDGKSLDERAYPWILNGLVRRHFERLKIRRSFLDKFEEWVSIFLAWWVVPITLLWFWIRYIPRHDWPGTYLHIGIATFSIAAGMIFYNSHALTLRGKKSNAFVLKNCWRDKRVFKCLGVVLSLLILIILSNGSINGTREIQVNRQSKLSFIPDIFSRVGYNVFANLVEKDISIKPEGFWSIDSLSRDSTITKAQLANADLRYANASSAFLAYADLRYADIRGAMLFDANLQGAILGKANLQHAILSEANLQGAKLNLANLQGAILWRTNLKGADLTYANLQGADLTMANMRGIDLSHTKNLTQKQLNRAYGDSLTKLPEGLTIPPCDTCHQYLLFRPDSSLNWYIRIKLDASLEK